MSASKSDETVSAASVGPRSDQDAETCGRIRESVQRAILQHERGESVPLDEALEEFLPARLRRTVTSS